MKEYRHGAHSVFEIHLHLVWVTKYRKPVLVGAVGVRLRELVREICGAEDVHILKGHVSKEHVHLLVSLPPQVTISRLVQRLKGKTAYINPATNLIRDSKDLVVSGGTPIVTGRGAIPCPAVGGWPRVGNYPMAIELPDGRCESNEVLEALRLRAVHARELGYAVIDIAAVLGVREETISRWCSRYDRGGREALPGDRIGRPIGSGRLLDREQEQGIRQALETKTPQELEIPSALWTRQAVRELIHQQVGLRLPIRTVGEYLRRWGYTPQKPVRKAYKQDPKAVAEWLEETYPAIERRAAKEDGEIH